MFKFATLPAPMSEVFVDAWHLFATTLRKVWYVVVVGIVLSMVFAVISKGHTVGLDFGHLKQQSQQVTTDQMLYAVISLVGFVVSLYILAIIMHRMQRCTEDANVKLLDSAVVSFKKLPVLLMNSLDKTGFNKALA